MVDKIYILLEDYGMTRVLEENDLTEEEVMEILINSGKIDMELYFKEDE